MSDTRRFAVRTIRDGKVRILGHDYTPVRLPCLPEHEGQRAAFGLYWGPPNFDRCDARGLMTSVSLWGSEAMYRAGTEEAFDLANSSNPFCVDGAYRWDWWGRVGAESSMDSGNRVRALRRRSVSGPQCGLHRFPLP